MDEIFVDLLQTHLASVRKGPLFTCPCFETAKNNIVNPKDEEVFILNSYVILFKWNESTQVMMIAM